MSLSGLPDELLLIIVGCVAYDHLPGSSVNFLELRCVSRKFDDIICVALVSMGRRGCNVPFKMLTIMPTTKAIAHFLDISQNKILRQVVENVQLRIKPLDLVEINEERWQEAYGHHILGSMMSFSMNDQSAEDGWMPSDIQIEEYDDYQYSSDDGESHVLRYSLYQSNLAAQRGMLNGPFSLSALSSILHALSNLRKLSTYELTFWCEEFCKNVEERAEGLMCLKLPERQSNAIQHYQMLLNLIEAGSDIQRISDFELQGFHPSALAAANAPSFFKHIPNIAEHIQDVHIGLCTWSVARGSDWDYETLANWQKLLNYFSNVRTLKISHVPECDDSPEYTCFTQCLAKLQFPRMTTFGLANIDVVAECLEQFLSNHAESLKAIDLDPWPLFDEDELRKSKPLLDTLRKKLNLQHARIVIHAEQPEDMHPDMIEILGNYLDKDKYLTKCATCSCRSGSTFHWNIGDYILS